jgi:protein-S-isoprenylcysteine O-methyltransferase Ste14
MNPTDKIALIVVLACVFILVASIMLAADILSKRISEGWLMVAMGVFAVLTITCAVAGSMRTMNERTKRRADSKAAHEARMEEIKNQTP